MTKKTPMAELAILDMNPETVTILELTAILRSQPQPATLLQLCPAHLKEFMDSDYYLAHPPTKEARLAGFLGRIHGTFIMSKPNTIFSSILYPDGEAEFFSSK